MNHYFLFWLKSSRGTDEKTVICSKTKNKEEIEQKLKNWCSLFSAWHSSENACSYGYKQIKLPPLSIISKQLTKLNVQKQKIIEKCKILNEMHTCRILNQRKK